MTGDSNIDSVTVAVECYLLLVDCDRFTTAKHSAAAALVTERQNWGEKSAVKSPLSAVTAVTIDSSSTRYRTTELGSKM